MSQIIFYYRIFLYYKCIFKLKEISIFSSNVLAFSIVCFKLYTVTIKTKIVKCCKQMLHLINLRKFN